MVMKADQNFLNEKKLQEELKLKNLVSQLTEEDELQIKKENENLKRN